MKRGSVTRNDSAEKPSVHTEPVEAFLAFFSRIRNEAARAELSVWPEVRDSWYFKGAVREVRESVDCLDHPIRRGRAAVCDSVPGGVKMKYKLLDTVVLDRDLAEHGLRSGDLGAVVEVYEPDGLEVEFVTASGKTQALVTLNVKDVRPVQDSDLIAVRSVA